MQPRWKGAISREFLYNVLLLSKCTWVLARTAGIAPRGCVCVCGRLTDWLEEVGELQGLQGVDLPAGLINVLAGEAKFFLRSRIALYIARDPKGSMGLCV
eukprot:1730504-Amphidinium_carterae.1